MFRCEVGGANQRVVEISVRKQLLSVPKVWTKQEYNCGIVRFYFILIFLVKTKSSFVLQSCVCVRVCARILAHTQWLAWQREQAPCPTVIFKNVWIPDLCELNQTELEPAGWLSHADTALFFAPGSSSHQITEWWLTPFHCTRTFSCILGSLLPPHK